MKKISFSIILLSLFAAFHSSSYAEQVLIPGHIPTHSIMELPQRGQNMESVRYKFGNPEKEKLPVGNPPITQWLYGDFNVFFEHQHVIHAINLNTLIIPHP